MDCTSLLKKKNHGPSFFQPIRAVGEAIFIMNRRTLFVLKPHQKIVNTMNFYPTILKIVKPAQQKLY